MLLMNRARSGSFKDISPITIKPMRGVTFFLMGASINVFVNLISFKDLAFTKSEYNLDLRVAKNEHTHAVLKTLGQQLDTRQMNIWDAAPR